MQFDPWKTVHKTLDRATLNQEIWCELLMGHLMALWVSMLQTMESCEVWSCWKSCTKAIVFASKKRNYEKVKLWVYIYVFKGNKWIKYKEKYYFIYT